MKNIDLSLNGILDYRWELREIGNKRIKLCYNSMKGIPTKAESEESIRKVLEAKGLDNIYVSGANGDIMITREKLGMPIATRKSEKSIEKEEYDPLSNCFGAEEDLLNKEERGIF